MKGCVRKELVAIGENGPDRSFDKVSDTPKQADGVLNFIRDTLGELARDTAEDQTIVDSLPPAFISSLRKDSHVLALDWHPHRSTVRLLRREGYTDVYTLSLADDDLSSSLGDDNSTSGTEILKLQLYKCTGDYGFEVGSTESEDEESVQLHPCGYFILQSSFALSNTHKYDDEVDETVTVSYVDAGYAVPSLACVLDGGFIFHGFRGRAKNTQTPAFFRQLCRTFDQFVVACGSATDQKRGPSFVCFTPRKQWRKKKFLAHTDLNYEVLTLTTTKDQARKPLRMYVYCCFKRQTVSALEQPRKTEASE